LTSFVAPDARLRVGLRALALAAVLMAGACASGQQQVQSAAAVTNPSLGPEYSTWMVGPVARLATPQEVSSYLALNDDAAAQEFIRQFWQRRNPRPDGSVNQILATFERRAAVADRLYGEAGLPGHQTPRGTIYVLYGKPHKIEFDDPPRRGEAAIEVWIYGPPDGKKTAPMPVPVPILGEDTGIDLDGKQPAERYRFIKRGEMTVPYVGSPGQQAVPPLLLPPPPARR